MRNLPQASSRVTSISRRKLYLAILTATQFMAVGQVWAGPEGGQIVGGAGSINQSGTETVINQQTDRMAIDWQNFDVKVDERVQFIQPNSSSVALNRVLSNKGSEILGRVDANGHVFLVNPNGVIFGKDSHINVGGILASGMSIDPTEFMNGNFTLNSLEGTEGKVINSGIINAATGGSVTLLGKEVKNEGLIVANLGSVNLAAGKEAVVTFDSSGLVGVKITKAVLQNELGVDAAVLNTGEINAQGGRILLTASTSQDIFSQAVNHGELSAATSAVVNEDGSFTLGAGADVVNTGSLNASSTNGDAGQIVALGNKVTNSGNISANTQNGQAGHIELNSTDTTQLTQNSIVSAQAVSSGEGGDIKVLGDKVGLFDTASVNASGANGGGQVLIGGDQTGKNKLVNNANFIYLDENTNAKTDALLNGNGGKLITFAQDTARIYGNLSARGGSESGNGGFIETSGLKGFEILNTPDISAQNGLGGAWLIDPYSINIVTGNGNTSIGPSSPFDPSGGTASLGVDKIVSALGTGATVTVTTGGLGTDDGGDSGGGDINLNAALIYNQSGGAYTGTLQLLANNNILINGNIKTSTNETLNLVLKANYNVNKPDNIGSGSGGITIAALATIDTKGGYFTASGKDFTLTNNSTPTTPISTGGGDIMLNMTGAINLGNYNTITTGGGSFTVGSPSNRATSFLSNGTDATIDTTSQTNGGAVAIYTTGDAKLGSVLFGRKDTGDTSIGNIEVDSSEGDIDLKGSYRYSTNTSTPVATMTLNAAGKITLTNVIIDNGPNGNGNGDNSALNLDFDAGSDITIDNDSGSGIWLTGGNADITSSGAILINNSRADYAALESEGGHITLDAGGAVEIKGNGVDTKGGNFTVLNSASFDNNFTVPINAMSVDSTIDTSSTNGGGNILINSAGDVTLGGLLFNDSLVNATAQTKVGTVTVVSGGSVTVNDAINFADVGSGSFFDISAAKNIDIKANILNNDASSPDKFNVILTADSVNNDAFTDGSITVDAGKIIDTKGGDLTAKGKNFTLTDSSSGTTSISTGGGKASLTMTGDVSVGNMNTILTSGGDFTSSSVNFTSFDDIKFGMLNVTGGTTDITATAAINLGTIVTKNLDIKGASANPSVSQSNTTGKNITVSGNATFNVGTGTITLNNAENNFQGTVFVTAAGNTSLRDADAIVFGASSISGDFDLTAGGDVTQSGALIIAGATTIHAANHSVVLAGANNFGGQVSFDNPITKLTLSDTNSLTVGNVTTTGGAIIINALNGFLTTGALVTTNANTDGGSITLSSTDALTTGALTADGGITNGVTAGKRGGDILLNANADMSVGAVSAKGSSASTTGVGGAGGNVTISSSTGSVIANAVATDGGNAAGTSFAGGAAGSISLSANASTKNILLKNNLSAKGGTKTGSASNGNGKNISLTGDVQIDNVSGVTVDATGLVSGNVSFTKKLDSVLLKNTNLTLNGNSITFGGDVGFTSRLGALKINSLTNFGINTQNFYATSFDATATSFSAGLIDTSGGADTDGGIVKITSTGNVQVASINSRGGTATTTPATGKNGGAVTVNGNSIALGTINTSGSDGTTNGGGAGDLSINALGAINLNGNITTEGGAGVASGTTKTAQVTATTTAASAINLGYGSEYTSAINIVGSGAGTITLTAQNLVNTWGIGGANNSLNKITFTGIKKIKAATGTTNVNTFTITADGGVTDITGGNGGDTFHLNGGPATTLSMKITGGSAADIFNIAANTTGTIDGKAGADNFNILLTDLTAADLIGNTSSATLTGPNTINNWFLLATGKSTLGNSDNTKIINFTGMNKLVGGAAVDNFVLGSSSITKTIDAGVDAVSDSLTAYDDVVDTNWTLTAEKSGTLSNVSTLTFNNIDILNGGSGKDKFTFSGSFSAPEFTGVINGKGGNDTFTLNHDVKGGVKGGDGNDTFDISSSIAGDIEGEAGADIFNINLADLTLNILGGTSSTASVVDADAIQGPNAINIWTMNGANSGKLTNTGLGVVTFSTLEKITGGSSNDELKSNTSGDNTWILDTKNNGKLNGLSFFGIEDLTGNANADTFTFNSSFSFDNTQNIDAVAGADNVVDYSLIANKSVALTLDGSGVFNSVKNASTVKGNNTNSTLTITSPTEVNWAITAPNDGTVSNAAQTIKFIDFTTLNGAAGNNIFSIANGSYFQGVINGGSTTNTLKNANLDASWTLTGANAGTLSIAGIQTTFTKIQTVEGSNFDTLTASNQANTWTITGSNSGRVGSLDFFKMKNLTGGTDVDDFSFTTGVITGVLDGGGNDKDTLTLGNDKHTWSLTGANSGTVTDDTNVKSYFTSFQYIEKLIGGTGDDLFNFSQDGTIVSVNGGDGSDTYSFKDIDSNIAKKVILDATASNGVTGIEKFIGNNNSTIETNNTSGTNTWSIYQFDGSVDGVDDGKVTLADNSIVSFVNFKNIIGGSGKDIFDFFANPGGSLTGKISGGGSNDEIIAPNLATKWTISDGGTNQFEYGTSLTKFESVEILTGSAANVDNFIFSGANTGTFNLAAKDATGVVDILDLSAITTPITLQLGAAGVGGLTVSGIEKVILGINTNNTLIGYSDGSNWDIDKLNGGTITSLSTTISASMQFEGFKNLTGADNASDVFTFKTGGSVTGTIDGGITNLLSENKIIGLNANNDWSFTANNVGKISTDGIEYLHEFKNIQTLEGGTLNDKFTVAVGKNYAGTIKGGIGSDSLAAIDGSNTFIINTTSSGLLNTSLKFEDIDNLVGGSGVDTFKFNITTAYGGAIDAGTGAGIIDVVDFNELTSAVTVALGVNTIQGVTNAEKVAGNSISETKLAAITTSGNNTWIVSSANMGTFQNAANNAIQFINFSNLLGATGFGDTFTLQGTGNVTTIDGGAGAGTNVLAKTDGTNTWALSNNVNSGTLNTSLQFTNIQLLNGGSGEDTLISHNKNNDWSITTENAGSLKENALTAKVDFSSMENLKGNAAVDAFSFSVGANITGLIDGGTSADSSGIVDTLNLQNLTSVSVELGDTNNPTLNPNLNVKNIETITAPTANPALNKLTGGSDRAYSWLIDGENTGTVSPTPASSTSVAAESITRFINFGSVVGGINADRFAITTLGDIKNIDGGNGLGDFVDYSDKKADIEIALDGSGALGITGITGIEGIVGNNNGLSPLNIYKSTIKISSGTNIWTLGSLDSVTDGINDGKLSINGSGTNVISFENFNILNGGSGIDTFNLTEKGKFVGTINGGSTDNVFNATNSTQEQLISINGATSGATNLVGFSSVIGSASVASELISLASANTWLLNAGATNVNNIKFTNFSSLKGSDGVDVFNIKNIDGLKVKINGGGTAGVNDVVDLTELPAATNVTVGIGATATTNIAVTNIEILNANSNDKNTLVADNTLSTNNWNIDGVNKGSLNSGITFSGFANLIGGVGVDNFIFTSDGVIGGLIDGGTSADSNSIFDVVNITAITTPVTVELGNTDTSNLNLLNIEDVKANANAGKTNKLIRNDNIAYTWVVSGANNGTVAPTTIAPALPLKETITNFSGFNQLQGGRNTDYFEISDAWLGSVDGGDGDDFVDYSKRTLAFTTTVGGTGNNGVKNVEGFVGNGINSTFEVLSGSNTWTIGKFVSGTDVRNDGINDGMVNINGAVKPVYFIDFNNIKGGADEDTFNIHSGELTGSIFAGAGNDKFNLSAGTVRGTLNGEDGDDTLNINIAETTAGKTNFVGGNGDKNTINLTGGGIGYLAAHASATNTSLSYEVNGKTSTIDYSGVATINDDVIADSLSLTGSLNSADTFALTTNSYSINSLTTINYKNKENLKISGKANDKVEINGAVNIPKILTIQNASVSEGVNGIINAEGLRLDGTAAVGSLDKRVKTNIENLYLSATLGETYLQEETSLSLASFNTDSLFDLTLGGNLTRSAVVASTGVFNVSTGASGSIILDSKSDKLDANRLTGDISFASPGEVSLSNSGVTTLNSVRAQKFSLDSTGAINAKGDINVTGVTEFNTTGNITAKSLANNFYGVLISNAADVDIVNKGKLVVQGIKASGNIITQSEGITVNGNIEGGNLDIKAGSEKAIIGSDISANNLLISAANIDINGNLTASSIDLNGSNGLVELDGTLSTLGKQTINITAGQIIQTAKVTSGGTTTLNATGDIQQKADITSGADILVKAGGNFSLDAGKVSTGNKVEYLVDGTANFSGNISAATGIHIVGAKNVTQSALFSSLDGDIVIKADDLSMTNGAVTTATKGKIAIDTINDISISALNAENAENGTVSLHTENGKVVDVNAGEINITANWFQVDSELGIGTSTDTDPIETSVSKLSILNNTGLVNIKNNIAVSIDSLRSNGNITFTNTGNVVLDNTSSTPYDRTEDDVRKAGGSMNANYEIGLLTINIEDEGDLLAIGAPSLDRPDITARAMTVNAPQGSIGSKARPLVIYVKEKLEAKVLKLYQPYWGFNDKPDIVTGAKPISTSISSDAGQLVQVETIAEVNPAIFTGVRNYVYDDIAILLPLDQRYSDKDTEQ